MTVWTAVGMLISASGHDDVQALATLRAWAYSRGRNLDEVAASLVNGVTPLETVLAN